MSHTNGNTPHETEDSRMRSERADLELQLYGILTLYSAQQTSTARGVVLREFARALRPLLDAKYGAAYVKAPAAFALVNPFDRLDAERCQRCGQQVKP